MSSLISRTALLVAGTVFAVLLTGTMAFAQCGGATGVPCAPGSGGSDNSGSGVDSTGGGGLPSWFPTNIRVTTSGGSMCIPGFGCFGGGPGGGWFNSGNGSVSGPFLHQQIDNAACRVLAIPEGSFGALIMIAAGLVAIVAGALGSYKLALSTIAIGAGAWILRPIVSLFFPIGCGGFSGTGT